MDFVNTMHLTVYAIDFYDRLVEYSWMKPISLSGVVNFINQHEHKITDNEFSWNEFDWEDFGFTTNVHPIYLMSEYIVILSELWNVHFWTL